MEELVALRACLERVDGTLENSTRGTRMTKQRSREDTLEREWDGISEIVRDETGEWEIPMANWEIEVLEDGLEENMGSIGGREDYICNARVRVTEPDGSQWTGLVDLDFADQG